MTTISTAPHAELAIAIRLADYMKAHNLEGPIEIGVSKASCYWCQQYLDFLHESLQPKLNIVNRATHGKCIDGWLIPDHPADIKRQMLDFVGDKMQAIFDLTNAHRCKSDSVPFDGLSSDEEMQLEINDRPLTY